MSQGGPDDGAMMPWARAGNLALVVLAWRQALRLQAARLWKI